MGGLIEDGGQALGGNPAILSLAPGVVCGDDHNSVNGPLAKPPEHVFPERFRYRR